mgnify:CR=1 FL=1
MLVIIVENTPKYVILITVNKFSSVTYSRRKMDE